ncbi:MAG: cell division transport system permease protein, partial [Fimbriimonadaceae bacterium]|nr:cell division transport system permease protein [Fimbriimonadaceae bacterium]
TVAISLFLLGGMGYAYYRIADYAEHTLPNKFSMEVILKDGTSFTEIKQTIDQIRGIEGVKAAVHVPKELAYPRLAKQLGLPEITGEIANPLPDQFNIVLKDVSEDTSASVGAQIQSLPAVKADGVRYLEAEQRFVDQMLRLLKLLGSLVGGLLFVTAGVLIYNAIRLTIVSRRLEIRVMQLVGASRFTIEVPFLFEGVFQGAVGGVLASLILWATHTLLAQALVGFEVFGPLPEFPVGLVMGVLAAIGAIYGSVSSVVALSSPMRYR